MAATPSNPCKLGSDLPAFALPDTVDGGVVSSVELGGAPLVVAFLANHCPFVRHIAPVLAEVARALIQEGARVVGISANDVERFPQDGPQAMAAEAARVGYAFPYLYDESQQVARSFDAACTPEFYVYDAGGKLAYHGQFDDSRPGNGLPVTGVDLSAAVRALLEGGRPDTVQRASVGCNIKWKVA